jgi:hypothetical protein
VGNKVGLPAGKPHRRGGYRPGAGRKCQYGPEPMDFPMRVPASRVAEVRAYLLSCPPGSMAAVQAVVAEWQALSVRSRSIKGVEELLVELVEALEA